MLILICLSVFYVPWVPISTGPLALESHETDVLLIFCIYFSVIEVSFHKIIND